VLSFENQKYIQQKQWTLYANEIVIDMHNNYNYKNSKKVNSFDILSALNSRVQWLSVLWKINHSVYLLSFVYFYW